MNREANSVTLDQMSRIIAGPDQVTRWKINDGICPPVGVRLNGKPSARRAGDLLVKSRREAVCWRVVQWIVLGRLAVCLSAASAAALDPGLAPGDNFDLSHWKLTLPDLAGTEIGAAQLDGGFTNSFFYTGSDGAMTFWCPVTGGV